MFAGRTEDDDTGGAVSDLLVLGPRELDHALGCRVGDLDLAQDGVAVVGEPAVGLSVAAALCGQSERERTSAFTGFRPWLSSNAIKGVSSQRGNMVTEA